MRFHSTPIDEHAEVPLSDEGRLEELISHFQPDGASASKQEERPNERRNACFVVSIYRPREEASALAQLDEVTALVEAQGDLVVGKQSHLLVKPDARTWIRKGVAERIGREAIECGADLLVLDAELSPSQARNLEDATGLPVCDREAVILNVFERHATTRRARIQVEIAHLEYLRPRIRGIGLNMDQQAGGIVGSRGAGETASELLARRLDRRLAELRRNLVQLKRSDGVQRKRRERCSRIVLVGYTNAGKTSLMNGLTAAGLSARDRPFETLDTTSRCLTRHGGDVLLSDTVGFIRRLPERLFTSFESTLAEVANATLLLVVVDVSDPERSEHLETTRSILLKLGADEVPRLVVFNKADLLTEPTSDTDLARLAGDAPFVRLSSQAPEDIAHLREQLIEMAHAEHVRREVFVPYALADVTRLIHARCRVLRTRSTEHGTQYLVEGEPHVIRDIARATRRSTR